MKLLKVIIFIALFALCKSENEANENKPESPATKSTTSTMTTVQSTTSLPEKEPEFDCLEPVGILTQNSRKLTKYEPITFVNYNTQVVDPEFEIKGQTFKMTFNNTSNQTKSWMSGGILLTDSFVLQEIHGSWGRKNSDGSQNFLNGKRFDMEVQLIHYNADCDNLMIAKGEPKGLLVVSFFYKVVWYKTTRFAPLIGFLQKASSKRKQILSERGIRIGDIFPVSKQKQYYVLQSSGCDGVINRIVFKEIQEIGFFEVYRF